MSDDDAERAVDAAAMADDALNSAAAALSPATAASVPLRILAQVGELVVIDKPAGMLVHNSAWAGGAREWTLVQALAATLGRPAWPLHRLDRGTSGVLLWTTARDAIEPLRAVLAKGHKDYVAVVRGRTLAAQVVVKPLRDDADVARAALTALAPLCCGPEERVSLVAARLGSGRTHQVRRHLAMAHHPVLGDVNHGDAKFHRALRARCGGPALALHAIAVTLPAAAALGWGAKLRLVAAPPWQPWAADLCGEAAVAAALAPWLGPDAGGEAAMASPLDGLISDSERAWALAERAAAGWSGR